MTTERERKRRARESGLTPPELELLEMLEQVLERFRWLRVLAHAQHYLLREKLKIPDEELDRVMKAAARTMETDAQYQRWLDGLARLKAEVVEGRRTIRREKRRRAREKRRGNEA